MQQLISLEEQEGEVQYAEKTTIGLSLAGTSTTRSSELPTDDKTSLEEEITFRRQQRSSDIPTEDKQSLEEEITCRRQVRKQNLFPIFKQLEEPVNTEVVEESIQPSGRTVTILRELCEENLKSRSRMVKTL